MIHHQSYLSARIVVMKIHQNSIRIIRLFFESTHFNSIQKILAEFHTIGDVVVTICPFPGFVGLLTKMPFLRLFRGSLVQPLVIVKTRAADESAWRNPDSFVPINIKFIHQYIYNIRDYKRRSAKYRYMYKIVIIVNQDKKRIKRR